MPTIDWNISVWDKAYAWPAHGDEWVDQAVFCNVSYEQWKSELIKTFIAANTRDNSTILEIGPGHGRWSEPLASFAKNGKLQLVDLSPKCIEYCKGRLAKFNNVEYWTNDGKNLPMIPDKSVDFIWSFDTFVHIEEPETRAYAKEFARILKRQSIGVIHHPGIPNITQRQQGARSMITSNLVSAILQANGLHVIRQTNSWGNGCNMKLTGDCLTVFVKL